MLLQMCLFFMCKRLICKCPFLLFCKSVSTFTGLYVVQLQCIYQCRNTHLERRLLQSLLQQLVDLTKTSCTIKNEICRWGINKILMSVCMKSLDYWNASKIVLVRLILIKKLAYRKPFPIRYLLCVNAATGIIVFPNRIFLHHSIPPFLMFILRYRNCKKFLYRISIPKGQILRLPSNDKGSSVFANFRYRNENPFLYHYNPRHYWAYVIWYRKYRKLLKQFIEIFYYIYIYLLCKYNIYLCNFYIKIKIYI